MNLTNIEAVKLVVGHAHGIHWDVVNVARLVINKMVVEFHARIVDRMRWTQFQSPKQSVLHEQMEGVVNRCNRDGGKLLSGLHEHFICRRMGGSVEHKLPDSNPLAGWRDARLTENV